MRDYAVVNALSLASDLSDSSHFMNSGQPAVAVVVDRSHIRKSPAELRRHQQHFSTFLAKFDTEFYSDFGRVPDPPLVLLCFNCVYPFRPNRNRFRINRFESVRERPPDRGRSNCRSNRNWTADPREIDRIKFVGLVVHVTEDNLKSHRLPAISGNGIARQIKYQSKRVMRAQIQSSYEHSRCIERLSQHRSRRKSLHKCIDDL